MATVPAAVTGTMIPASWGNAVANAINGFDNWTAYTPTVTGITNGNGTKGGYYCRIGGLVHYIASFTLGTTSAVTGPPVFTLPVASKAVYSQHLHSQVAFYDASAGLIYPAQALHTTTTVAGYALATASAYLSWASPTSTVPFTWAVNDFVSFAGWYVAA